MGLRILASLIVPLIACFMIHAGAVDGGEQLGGLYKMLATPRKLVLIGVPLTLIYFAMCPLFCLADLAWLIWKVVSGFVVWLWRNEPLDGDHA